jgi:hypothetical protein
MQGFRRSWVVAAALIAAIGCSSAAAAASLGPGSDAALRSAGPAVEICGQGPAVVRPTSMILTCADAGEIAKSLHWTSWSRTSATATGLVTWLTGGANHARSSSRDSARSDFTLAGPVAEADGEVLFTKLEVRVIGATPNKYMRDVTYSEAPPTITALPYKASGQAAAAPGTAVPANAASGTLAFAEIEGFWVDAGGPSGDVSTIYGTYPAPAVAAALTLYESSYAPGNIQLDNPYSTTGWGLWQITPGDSEPAYGEDYQLLDPWNNAEAAVLKCLNAAAGDETYGCWTPWTTYTGKPWENTLNGMTIPAPDTNLTDPGQYVPYSDYTGSANNSSDPGSTYGPPMPGEDEVAFQANTNILYAYDPATNGNVDSHLGMQAGTSPSYSNGEIAFQANTGILYVYDIASNGNVDSHLGMSGGTSPALAYSTSSGFEVAFHASNGDLYLYNPQTNGNVDTGLAVAAGSSPAIEPDGSGFDVAYQGVNGDLDIYSSSGATESSGLGMEADTSPSYAGGIVAFQANSGLLYLYDPGDNSNVDSHLGMAADTSPAIADSSSGYEVAFQANSGILYSYDPSGNSNVDSHLGMEADTSPAIESIGSGFETAFQANSGILYTWTPATNASVDSHLGMATGTSPGAN